MIEYECERSGETMLVSSLTITVNTGLMWYWNEVQIIFRLISLGNNKTLQSKKQNKKIFRTKVFSRFNTFFKYHKNISEKKEKHFISK